MITPTPRELIDRLVSGFDRQSELRLDRALISLLRDMGFGKFESDELAWKMEPRVLALLLEIEAEDLPFRLSDGARRLVGKTRFGARDTQETKFAKQAEGLSRQLLEAVLGVTPSDFEIICAASMVLSGAHDVRAICAGDEGGIDFYGRLPVREPSTVVPKGIIHTTLLPRDLLLLGQAKMHKPNFRVGRPDIQQFKGQVNDCLKKYEGNSLPPSHRVPDSFYRRDEPHLGVFVTTASFADTACECVEASGIVLVRGIELAQFLCFHRVGIVEDQNGFRFDQNAFRLWLQGQTAALALKD